MREDKDRTGKWLIDNHGDAILKLAKITGFIACRAAKSELVAPRRLPDGLVEVTFPDQARPDPFIVEIETYADRRVAPQVFEDILITRMERGVISDVISLVLRPKGQAQVEQRVQESSRHGLTALACNWHLVELWKLNAEDLLAANDVGLIPWVPLTRFSGPPEPILRQCRERIDKQAEPSEHEALLTVTSLLTAVVYNDEALLAIFGGVKPMIESPLLDRILAQKVRQTTQMNLLEFLESRFGKLPAPLAETIRSIVDEAHLNRLIRIAGTCSDLDAFRNHLTIQ